MEKSSLILHTLNNNTKNTSEMDVNNVEPIDSTLFSMYNNDNNYHHDDDNLVKFTANRFVILIDYCYLSKKNLQFFQIN